MKAGKKSGVAGITVDSVEEGVHAQEGHGGAVQVERSIERGECLVNAVGAEVVPGKLSR